MEREGRPDIEFKAPNISEEPEVTPEQVEIATKTLEDFLRLKPEESVVLIKDAATNPETAAILKQAIERIGSAYTEVLIDKKTKKKDVNALMKEHQVLMTLVTEHEGKLEGLYDGITKRGNRMAALFDLSPDAFKPGSAMTENREELDARLNRMEAVLKEAAGFKITSEYGTNLEVGMRQFGERKWYKDSGAIDQPGIWSNLPGGEIFTTPDEGRVNGVLVLPALDTGISEHQGVDEFVRVHVKDGLIVEIEGGKSADTMRKQLEEDAKNEEKEGRNPNNAYRIAEIAFGANSKARGVVADVEQSYDAPATPTIEAEKRFGTMHFAFGSSGHGAEGSDGFERDTESHYDFVLPRNGLTVEMFNRYEDFKNQKNGRKIINEGGINYA